MAKTPVSIAIDDYKEREVLMVTYEFTQATDVEGQMAGIPRGGKITVRVKALNDGTPDLLAYAAFPFVGKRSNPFDDAKLRRILAHCNFFCRFLLKYRRQRNQFATICPKWLKICRESVKFL